MWGRRAERLERQLARASASAVREWRARGVVRAVLPDADVVVLTHEEIPGYMAAMTMGFTIASPEIREGVHVGDEVRFTVRGIPPNVIVTSIEKIR